MSKVKNLFLKEYADEIHSIASQVNRMVIKLYTTKILYVLPFSLPVVLGLVLLFLSDHGAKVNLSFLSNTDMVVKYLSLYFILCTVVALLMKLYWYIHRLVWIDLSFDNKIKKDIFEVKITRKLFVTALWFKIKVFFRYEIFSWVLIFGSLALSPFLMSFFDLIGLYAYALHITFVTEIVLLTLSAWYTYYVHLNKIRYIWFLFIDSYSEKGVRFFDVVREMNRLNKTSKTTEYMKSVENALGETSVNKIQNKIISLMRDRVSITYSLDSSLDRKLRSNLLYSIFFYDRITIGEVYKYTTLISKYLLYKLARQIEYKEEQYINTELYDSLNKKN